MATFKKALAAGVAALLYAASCSAFVFVPITSTLSSLRVRDASSYKQQAARSKTQHRSETSIMSLTTVPPASLPTAEVDTRRRGVIKSISSHDQFLHVLAEHQDKLVVVKFYDQFCRACDEIAPRYEELSAAHGDFAEFFQVEFSSAKDVCKQLGIRRLPTVQMYTGEGGRVADLPAGPSRFLQVEERCAEILAKQEA